MMEPRKSNRAKRGIVFTAEMVTIMTANRINGISSRIISFFDVM